MPGVDKKDPLDFSNTTAKQSTQPIMQSTQPIMQPTQPMKQPLFEKAMFGPHLEDDNRVSWSNWFQSNKQNSQQYLFEKAFFGPDRNIEN
jgi:hypothetical protein